MNSPRDAAAALLDDAAEELRLAAAHLGDAANHFRNHEVPRACAHQWAARGHLLNALAAMDEQSREHAARSTTVAE